MTKLLGYSKQGTAPDALSFIAEMARAQEGKPALFLDIDDVLADCKGGLWKRAHDVGIDELPEPEDFQFSNWNELQRHFAYSCFQDFHFYHSLQPHRGVKDAMWRLAQDFKLVGITARAYNKHKRTHNELIQYVTERWLYLWELPMGKVVYSPSAGKVPFILGPEADKPVVGLVEDNETTAKSAADAGILTFLIDRPWNRSLECEGPLLKRVDSLRDVEPRLKLYCALNALGN